MEKHNQIVLVAATDNFYAILLAALLKSIEVNHISGEPIAFYIIDDGISEKNKQMLIGSVSSEMFTLYWLKTKDVVPKDVKIPTDKSAFPITTYLRLFAPYVIPASATKMIYLDVDMILMKDISELWKIDLQGHLFAAAQDLCEIVGSDWGGIPNYKALGIDPASKYFNAGLLMLDPIQWRAKDVSNKVIKAINDNMDSVNFADQYGLNVVLHNQWLELDRRWNTFSILDVKDPFLVHFLDIKPIFKSYNTNRTYYDAFYRYLRLTPFKSFKPVSDYKRLLRKGIIKLGKIFK